MTACGLGERGCARHLFRAPLRPRTLARGGRAAHRGLCLGDLVHARGHHGIRFHLSTAPRTPGGGRYPRTLSLTLCERVRRGLTASGAGRL
eukprot:scaffold90909_cov36-Phaeocystis_antarctica.AAC.1